MIKKIITRVIVAVGVIFCLSYLSQFFPFLNFVLPVYAEENETPVYVYTPQGDELINKDGIISNTFDNNYEQLLENQFYLYTINPSDTDCQNGDCYTLDSPDEGFWYYSYDDDIEFPHSVYQNAYTYVGSTYFTFSPGMKVRNNHHYTFYYLLEKTSNSVRFNSDISDDFSLTAINMVSNRLSERNMIDNVFNLSATIDYQYLGLDSNDSPKQGDYIWFKVEFDTSSNLSSYFNDEDVYLSSILFEIDTPRHYVQPPFNFLMYFPSYNQDTIFKQHTYFIEDGDIVFNGVQCDKNSNSCHNGMYYSDKYDIVHSDDIAVLNGIPVCESTDLICHIRRLFDMIYNFFVRFGNFIDKFFTDSDTIINQKFYDFINNFQLENGGLSSVVSAPLNLISSLNTTSCQNIQFTLLNQNVNVSCLTSSVYRVYFPTLFTLYQTIMTGIICYGCLLNMFKIIRGLQSPDSDKVEVLDL